MNLKSITFGTVFTIIASFSMSGCATYYSTAPVKYDIQPVEKKIPVNVELTQKDWSIVINPPQETVRKNITDILFDSPVFTEQSNAAKTMKIDILHRNDHGGAELAGAMLTGATLYLVPGVADSDVDITISMDNVSTKYTGELIVAQGMASSSLVDKQKYVQDSPMNLMKNLLQNAVNEFTTVYLKSQQ